MTLSQPTPQHKHLYVSINEFSVCLIDGKTKEEISQRYRGKQHGRRYLEKFCRYLSDEHDIGIKDYCVRYGAIDWPKGLDGMSDASYDITRPWGLVLRLSVVEVGGKRQRLSWNQGLAGTDHPSLLKLSRLKKGVKRSPREIENMKAGIAKAKPTRAAYKPRPCSEKTREKFRRQAAIRWATGGFGRDGVTSIHLKIREFLSHLPLNERPREEWAEIYYSIDFAFTEAKVAIECDGDYFHVNPRFYPNGPKDEIQRRNSVRDKAKNTFLLNRGWTVIRIWECDINAGTYKDALLCKLKQSGLLDA